MGTAIGPLTWQIPPTVVSSTSQNYRSLKKSWTMATTRTPNLNLNPNLVKGANLIYPSYSAASLGKPSWALTTKVFPEA